jgi:hypothetical protein
MAFSFVAVSIPTVADKLDEIAKFSRDEWKTLGLRSLNQAIPKRIRANGMCANSRGNCPLVRLL